MSIEELHASAIEFIVSHVPEWASATLENTTLIRLTGNSNKVYLVQTTLNVTPPKLIYRVFGPDHTTIKSRERKIFNALSVLGHAPKTYGDSEIERLEDFLEGFEHVPRTMFYDPLILELVAKKLRELHSIDITHALEGEPVMVEENPRRWREYNLSRLAENPNFIHVEEARREIEELLSPPLWDMYLDILPRNSPVVFSHLDPNPLNFLYNPELQEVYFIDFEFSGYGYRGIDIAQVLDGVPYDFLHKEYPFWKYYEELTVSDDIIEKYVRAYGEGAEMWVEVKRCLIASQYIWATWGLASYKGPSSGYDYLEYSLQRFRRFKAEYTAFKEVGAEEWLERGRKRFSE